MVDIFDIDYSQLDRPEVVDFLFHPRPEWQSSENSVGIQDVGISSYDDTMLWGRFHVAGESSPNILFFHGNGEIVSDYDDLGPVYTRLGINFFPVDYRGYGRSGGRPTITGMMRDAHVIFEYTCERLLGNGFNGPLMVMGRSLGSASALEIAEHYQDRIDGLIIESGFAHTGLLLGLLGFDMAAAGLSEEDGFGNLKKIRSFLKPTMVIHAEMDHLLPFSEGQALYDASPARDKKLLNIPGANHNDIFIRGFDTYMGAIVEFLKGMIHGFS